MLALTAMLPDRVPLEQMWLKVADGAEPFPPTTLGPWRLSSAAIYAACNPGSLISPYTFPRLIL